MIIDCNGVSVLRTTTDFGQCNRHSHRYCWAPEGCLDPRAWSKSTITCAANRWSVYATDSIIISYGVLLPLLRITSNTACNATEYGTLGTRFHVAFSKEFVIHFDSSVRPSPLTILLCTVRSTSLCPWAVAEISAIPASK